MLGLDQYDDLINACFSYGVPPVVTLAHGEQTLAHAKVHQLYKEGFKGAGCMPLHLVKNIAFPPDPTNYSDAQAALHYKNISSASKQAPCKNAHRFDSSEPNLQRICVAGTMTAKFVQNHALKYFCMRGPFRVSPLKYGHVSHGFLTTSLRYINNTIGFFQSSSILLNSQPGLQMMPTLTERMYPTHSTLPASSQ